MMVQKYGTKKCLVGGGFCFVVFVISTSVAASIPAIKYPVAIIGALIGGTGSGVMWTGQGVYYARTCDVYSSRTGLSIEESSNKFGGIFATVYLLAELVLKGMSSPLIALVGDKGLFFTYCTLAVVSVAALSQMTDIDALSPSCAPPKPKRSKYGSIADEGMVDDAPVDDPFATMKAVINLFMTERKLQLMAMTQIAFGFYVPFLNYYLDGRVIPIRLGKEYIGIFATITVAVGAVISYYSPTINRHFGKSFTLALGALSFMALAAPFMAMSAPAYEATVFELFLVYFLAGFGRASYESANKSIFVDFFPNDKEAAFPNIMLLSGIATFFGFMVFPHLSPICMSLILFCTSLAGIIGYVFAKRIHDREMKARFTEAKLDPKAAMSASLLVSRERTFSTQAGLMSTSATLHNRSRRASVSGRSRRHSAESQMPSAKPTRHRAGSLTPSQKKRTKSQPPGFAPPVILPVSTARGQRSSSEAAQMMIAAATIEENTTVGSAAQQSVLVVVVSSEGEQLSPVDGTKAPATLVEAPGSLAGMVEEGTVADEGSEDEDEDEDEYEDEDELDAYEYENADDFVYDDEDDDELEEVESRGRTWTAANLQDKPISYAALWYLQGDRGRSTTMG
jgi:hypothetical protein